MASLTERVVQRATRQAKEFTSPEALREYLKEHPDADKAKHTVKKPGGPGKKQPPPIPDAAKKKQVPPAPKPEVKKEEPKAPKPEAKKPEAKKPHHDEHGDHDEHEAPKGAKPGRLETWKDTLKGLSDAAQSFAKSAPKAIKSFLGDHEFRKNTLKEAGSHLAKTPKKMLDNLVDTAKHEVKEFKDAAAGVKSVLSGGKMTKHQKHAFRAVATHLAIGGAAAALTATGPLGAAGIFAKGLARHIAAKSVHKSMGHLHVMDELGHVGHGIAHLMEHFASEEGKKGANPEEVMTNFILAAVAKTLEEDLSDEDLTKILNEMKGGDDESEKKPKEKTASERVAARFLVP